MDFDFQSWVLGFVRASGFLLMLPVFSAANVPVVLRVALGAFLGFLVAPVIIDHSLMGATFLGSITQLIVEAFIGIALGFVARIALGAFEIAGQFISAELGLNMSSVLNPINTMPTQAPGMLLLL